MGLRLVAKCTLCLTSSSVEFLTLQATNVDYSLYTACWSFIGSLPAIAIEQNKEAMRTSASMTTGDLQKPKFLFQSVISCIAGWE